MKSFQTGKSALFAIFASFVAILLVVFVSIFPLKTSFAQSEATCPKGNGWVKIDSNDLSSYPVNGATSYCFKAGSDNSQGCQGGLFNSIPEGGFTGAYCGLSHWSYFIGASSPTGTPVPTASSTAQPSSRPAKSPSPTNSPIPTPTSTFAGTPTATPFVFPRCEDFLPNPGNIAHYTTGMHQIVGGPLLPGSDDVYSLNGGNYLQCFCPEDPGTGIQTNWLRTNDPITGWFFVNGSQWNLGNFMYAAQNSNFSCDGDPESSPTPVASFTPVPTSTPTSNGGDGRGDGLGCAVNDCSSHPDNRIEGYGTGGQILGASTLAATGTFTETFYQVIMGIGGTLTTFGIKGLKKAKKTSKRSVSKK